MWKPIITQVSNRPRPQYIVTSSKLIQLYGLTVGNPDDLILTHVKLVTCNQPGFTNSPLNAKEIDV